jgi:FtsH-binding integral membrane protein
MPLHVWVEAAVGLLAFFVVVPLIAIVIGRAAWLGKPENWDRSMYWTAFAVSMVAATLLMVYAQRMQADVRTWRYPVQMALFWVGVLFFGVALGCGVGIFTYRRGKGPIWRATPSRAQQSTDDLASEHKSDK